MKKFGLILVSIFLLTVLISLNYLLWDRDNTIKSMQNINSTLYSSNSSNKASIDALGDNIKTLTESNKELDSKIYDLKSQNQALQDGWNKEKEDKANIDKDLQQKNDTIGKLKLQANLSPLELTIKRWADSIDKGNYDDAYSLELSHNDAKGSAISRLDYANAYRNSIKSLKIKKQIKLAEDSLASTGGNITFLVICDVKLVDNSQVVGYSDGENERLFTVIYSKTDSKWVISDISTSP
jgi:hypothetical protein